MARIDRATDMAADLAADVAKQTPAEIAARLDKDRDALARSIEGLRDRLAPETLLDDVIGYAKANIAPYAQAVDRTVRANPLAAVLAGAAVAWLVLGRKGGSQPDAAAHAAQTQVYADRADADQVWASASVLQDAERLQDQERLVEDWIRSTLEDTDAQQAAARQPGRLIEDRPLLAAGIGMAIGAAVGAILPRTAVEDRVLGPDRDLLLAQARAVLREEENRVTQSSVTFATTLASGLVASLASSLANTLASRVAAAKDDKPEGRS